jgi:hypothetical protein
MVVREVTIIDGGLQSSSSYMLEVNLQGMIYNFVPYL